MGHKLKLDDLALLLDSASRQLDPATLDRLQAVRRQALDRQRSAAPVPLLARLHHLVTDHGDGVHHHRPLNWVGALLLLLAILAGGWQLRQSTFHDHADLDLAILTDDLPLRMYVD
ncbi:MAG: DUF3619 family protein [Sideroxydans sp.]|nr:DUF3619 family protein [Sideroxydans sp.]